MGQDHVHAARLQVIHRRARAREGPGHLRIIRRGEALGQGLEQAKFARAAGGQAEALAARASDNLGLLRQGRAGREHGHGKDPPPHDAGSGWVALGKNSCSPPI